MCVIKMIETGSKTDDVTPKSKLLMMIYRDVHERDEGNQTLLQPRPTHPLQREQRDQCKLIIIKFLAVQDSSIGDIVTH